MSATLLSGRAVRDARIPQLIEQVKRLSCVPKLTIIQVGDRSDSAVFIKAKQAFAKKVGVETEYIHVPETISQADLISKIRVCNTDDSIHGIIVQLPLPQHIERESVIEAIDPRKDTDGLTLVNYKKLQTGDPTGIVPATARGIQELFDFYGIPLKGKKVAVVGRSYLVGTPIALVCKNAGAEVTVCHSQTKDVAIKTKEADIVIVAVGKLGLIGPDHLKPGHIVIDVGINRMPDGALKGDVDFDAVKDMVAAITPVPGGVGPMTVLALMENLVDASCK